MKNPGESAVDRLIALALEQKPAPQTAERELETPVWADPALPSLREIENNPVWRALLQIGAFLPHMARVLDIGAPVPTTALSTELRQSVGGLESAHRDLRMAVVEQTAEMKRMELTVAKTQEVADRNASELMELGDDVRSMRTLVKVAVGILLLLVVGLTGTVIFLLVRLSHGH